MSAIERMPVTTEHGACLAADIERMLARISFRTYEHFVRGGCINGYEIDDWLRAVEELLLKPKVHLRSDGRGFIVETVLPQMHLENLSVRLTPRQMLITSTPRDGRGIFRIVSFPQAVDPVGTTAEVENGLLRVRAPHAIEGD